MIRKLILLIAIFLSSVTNAASCLSESEKNTIDRNYINSKEKYGHIGINCNVPSLKTFCSDPYYVKMTDTVIRMIVWDTEQELKEKYSTKDLSNLVDIFTDEAVKETCESLKITFFSNLRTKNMWDKN